MAKNIQSISRLLREHPHPGLQNEPPLDSLDPQSPNPFMASPSPDPIQRLAIKGFRDWGSRLSSGGSFRSPGWGRSRSSLEIDWIFFCHFNFPESAVLYYSCVSWDLPKYLHIAIIKRFGCNDACISVPFFRTLPCFKSQFSIIVDIRTAWLWWQTGKIAMGRLH